MNIIIVSELFLPSLGGQEVRYAEMAPLLAKAGHNVTILTIGHRSDLPAEEIVSGVQIRRLLSVNDYVVHGRAGRNPWRIIQFCALLTTKFRESLCEADIVIFNKWPILPQLWLRWLLPIRAVIDWCEIRDGTVWELVYHAMGNIGAAHIAVSDEISGYIGSRLGVSGRYIRTIVSGVYGCVSEKDAIRRNRQILYFGRLSPHKNPDLLAKAFVRSFAPDSGYTLVVAGDGEMLPVLKDLAAGFPHVTFAGRVSDAERVMLLRESAVIVLPSKREGFPRVIAEAAAFGTPTITTDYATNGGAFVVKQYGLGWVVSPTEQDLARAISIAGNVDSDVWRECSARVARQCEQYFVWPRVIESLLDFAVGLSYAPRLV